MRVEWSLLVVARLVSVQGSGVRQRGRGMCGSGWGVHQDPLILPHLAAMKLHFVSQADDTRQSPGHTQRPRRPSY